MMLAGIFTFQLPRHMGLRRPAALLGATCRAAWLPPAILTVTELARKIETRWISILIGSIAPSILSGYAATVAVVAGPIWASPGARLGSGRLR
jgi:hypothetical protein